MATQNRKSFGSMRTTSSSLVAKRHALSSENVNGKLTVVPPHLPKKRPPLSNLTNQTRSSMGSTASLVPCAAAKIIQAKKGSSSSISGHTRFSKSTLPASLKTKSAAVISRTSFPKNDETISHVAELPAPSSGDISQTPADVFSVSMDESMSTCGSLKSPEVVYLDQNDKAAVHSIPRKTFINHHKSETERIAGNACKREILGEIEMVDEVSNVDDNFMDPQFCATISCDIYNHLRASEIKKRPSTDFMEKIQKDINASMRAILIDWLVEVAVEYRLVPDTLYLTVNYIDRYLSGNPVNRKHLQLLGVVCMMIAAKYEEICAPQVEEFCYITDNTYVKEEVLQMESAVLNFLKFEMTAPTTKCFLRRFVRAAQAMNEAPSLHLECLSNYIAELSLLEYGMLQYFPSLVAASAIFLAQYILTPSKRPWNSTLRYYTLYEPSDLHDCVQALHQLCLNSHSSSLPAIREKYSHHKYKFVAKKHCPPSVPSEYFAIEAR